MVRIAAIGDLHLAKDDVAAWRTALASAADEADLLLLAGDLTREGTVDDGVALLRALDRIRIPVIAVLGNHDFHADEEQTLAEMLESIGVDVLEGSGAVFAVDGVRVGIAGTKGFGGGFDGTAGTEFGERQMKRFIAHSRRLASRLETVLRALDTDVRIALLHYAPIAATIRGEAPEIYPFLGSSLFAEAIDRSGADLVLHGHAHRGSQRGTTPGGVRVENVAQTVIQRPYVVLQLGVEAHGRSRDLDRASRRDATEAP